MLLSSFFLVSPPQKVFLNQVTLHLMDTNNPASWDLELMAMEEHILQSQLPFNHSLLPYIPIDQIPSNNTPISALLNSQVACCVKSDEQESDQDLDVAKEMMYRIASMQPVDIDPATIRKRKRKNVRISDDPQSIAARLRREKISEKIRILQRLVPGGTRLDTASMLDEAIRYIKFLKRQIRFFQCNHQPQNNSFSLYSSSSTPLNWPLRANGGSASTQPGFGSS